MKLDVFLLNCLFLWFIFSCNNQQNIEKTISFNDTHISYTGRVNFNNDTAAIIYWPGTSIQINFEGSDIDIAMQDTSGKNYYNVILDNDSIFIFKPDTLKKWTNLISNIQYGKHHLEIFKRTEWRYGPNYFYGFKLKNNTKLLLPPKKKKVTIELFGNSITAGFAIEDTIGDNPLGLNTNNFLTYGAIVARHFNANYYCTARGGIGITVSWFPLIMSEMYNRLDPMDSLSKWDFSVKPDLVIINLFQNDSWIVDLPDEPEFKHRFGNKKPTEDFIISKYEEFLNMIRKVYPKANIICTLGTMDATRKGSPWTKYIKEAVKRTNDSNIYTLFFPYQNYEGHPEIRTHKVMADSLIKFIDKNNLLNNH